MRQNADEVPELPQSRQRGSIIPANFSGGNCEGFMPDQGHESRHALPVFRDLGGDGFCEIPWITVQRLAGQD